MGGTSITQRQQQQKQKQQLTATGARGPSEDTLASSGAANPLQRRGKRTLPAWLCLPASSCSGMTNRVRISTAWSCDALFLNAFAASVYACDDS